MTHKLEKKGNHIYVYLRRDTEPTYRLVFDRSSYNTIWHVEEQSKFLWWWSWSPVEWCMMGLGANYHPLQCSSIKEALWELQLRDSPI